MMVGPALVPVNLLALDETPNLSDCFGGRRLGL